ncbi:MAG: CBS domain-containing protein, partial [Actinomycetota bacterium]
MEIILSHVNPDFDSLAAMVAAQKLFPGAKLVFTGSQNKNVREFIQLHRDILDFLDARQVDPVRVKRVIVVDTRIAERLGELGRVVKRRGVETVVFDHHPATPDDIKATKEFSAEVGAVTTILVEMLQEKNIPISPFEATLFALGIHEDTGSLTYAATTHRDAEALSFLVQKNANIDVVHRFLDFSLDEEQRGLLKKLLDSARIIDVRGRKVLFTSAKVPEYVDSAATLTHKVGDLENVDIVFTLLQLKDQVNVIARSRGEIDMGKFLEKFGGGGHPQAASASVRGATIRRLEEELLEEISHQIKPPPLAQEIMAKPLMVDITTSVKKAQSEMQRYGVTGLPVIEEGKLVGVISKRDVEKAAAHRLTHAPVKGFMSRKVVTISPETPLHKILELLSESEVDRLPVVEDKKVVGIVSRREALRAVHGPGYLSPFRASAEPKARIPREEIVSRLNSLLPHKVRSLLTEIGSLAEENGLNAYLVGGFVRDLIMNHRNLDIDLVVEGNGIMFARRMAKKFAGRLTYHEKFGTAVVVLPDDFRIDVASARTEFYEYPAALPQVEFGTVRQDLFR